MSRTFGHFKDKDTEAQPGSSNWLKVMWLMKAASRIPAHMPGPSAPPTNHSCCPHPLFFELGRVWPRRWEMVPHRALQSPVWPVPLLILGLVPRASSSQRAVRDPPTGFWETSLCGVFFWPFPGKEEGNAISGNPACWLDRKDVYGFQGAPLSQSYSEKEIVFVCCTNEIAILTEGSPQNSITPAKPTASISSVPFSCSLSFPGWSHVLVSPFCLAPLWASRTVAGKWGETDLSPSLLRCPAKVLNLKH